MRRKRTPRKCAAGAKVYAFVNRKSLFDRRLRGLRDEDVQTAQQAPDVTRLIRRDLMSNSSMDWVNLDSRNERLVDAATLQARLAPVPVGAPATEPAPAAGPPSDLVHDGEPPPGTDPPSGGQRSCRARPADRSRVMANHQAGARQR